jgi:endonuclease/exonuclease/phosphatase family metal-dependent hydrolase
MLLLLACSTPPAEEPDTPPARDPVTLRVATYNAALARDDAGALLAELQAGSSDAANIAQVIQRVRPDVLVLQEFDYDAQSQALAVFQQDYLAVSQDGQDPITYAHAWVIASNTGVPTGLDLDDDGASDGPGDAHGWGEHPGQYAFVVLSQVPLAGELRSWQNLLWSSMPDNLLPTDFYDAQAQATLRLSSKNHVALPLDTVAGTVHLLVAHPTPPVFDGPEDRNGRRNHDEVRLLADIAAGLDWMVDDAGQSGGLPSGAALVACGDLNADPNEGDGWPGTMDALFDLSHPELTRGDQVPSSAGAVKAGQDATDTASWGLRVDYALPAASVDFTDTGVFWPENTEPGGTAVRASDHRLVWVDLSL